MFESVKPKYKVTARVIIRSLLLLMATLLESNLAFPLKSKSIGELIGRRIRLRTISECRLSTTKLTRTSSLLRRQKTLFLFTPRGSRPFRATTAVQLNRFLFDPCELDELSSSTSSGTLHDIEKGTPTVTLPKDDYRTIHAAKILNLQNGDTIRAGVVADMQDETAAFITSPSSVVDNDNGIIGTNSSYHRVAGHITDRATIQWLPEGKIKKAQPTKNGDPPGSIRITLHNLVLPQDEYSGNITAANSPVSLILALPRPLQLGRILPMIAQLGVHHLVLTSASKVPKDYFGSHLFRKPNVLRRHLIEGLCQAGDVHMPKVTIVRRLKIFLKDDLNDLFPPGEYARVITHPQRRSDVDVGTASSSSSSVAAPPPPPPPPLRMRDIAFPQQSTYEGTSSPFKVVVAVGPEGGWAEDYELDMFESCGFQRVTMGTRVLRSDVAVVSLLSLAHDVCAARATSSLVRRDVCTTQEHHSTVDHVSG